jgi:hypothetical protein
VTVGGTSPIQSQIHRAVAAVPDGRTASGGSGHTIHHRPAGSAPAAS